MEVLSYKGYSSRGIAKILNFHHFTIVTELQRCKRTYKAIEADKDTRYEPSFRGRKTKSTDAIKNKIHDKLKLQMVVGTN
ncbi:hypothetical protein [Peptoniphilus equinus]|uniref:hypothetical protein n=1 Tax=Peptoniphilus equinus TaxID=3016343 RepID=UPI0036F3E7D7